MTVIQENQVIVLFSREEDEKQVKIWGRIVGGRENVPHPQKRVLIKNYNPRRTDRSDTFPQQGERWVCNIEDEIKPQNPTKGTNLVSLVYKMQNAIQ